MAEYIEREALLLRIDCYGTNKFGMLDEDIRAFVKAQPAANVAPVVHGRWEMRPTGMVTDTGPEYKAYCTVCNEPNKQYQPPFCPHCGAKMDGGDSGAGD